MDQELKAKWVKALRGRKFQQGRGRLKYKASDGKLLHCCLGVLCEVAGRSIKPIGAHQDHYAWCDNLLGDNRFELARRNDGKRHSFAQIADYIEANLL